MRLNETATELLTPQSQDLIRREADDFDNPRGYTFSLAVTNIGKPLTVKLTQASEIIEPYDPDLDGVIDKDPVYRDAFIRGGLLAVRLCYEHFGSNFRGEMRDFEHGLEPLPDPKDPFYPESRKDRTEALREFSEDGWKVAQPTFGDLFEQWEDIVVPDISAQYYLRPGFGYIVQLASKAEEVIASKLEAVASAPSDAWDDAMTRELSL
ncbi:MAG TPA: hypothetical protein PKB09_02010 [Candidatus Saccharibacteria bacterium]|nr:hypothetical protein [Candidatus Saccharibacteria bacterium]